MDCETFAVTDSLEAAVRWCKRRTKQLNYFAGPVELLGCSDYWNKGPPFLSSDLQNGDTDEEITIGVTTHEVTSLDDMSSSEEEDDGAGKVLDDEKPGAAAGSAGES